MLRALDHLGVRSDCSETQKSKIILSNRLNLIVISVMTVAYVVNSIYEINKGREELFYFSSELIMILACIIHLILNANCLFKIVRIMMLIDIPLIICFVNPIRFGVVNDYYFWLPYIPVSFSIASYYLFNEKSEMKWILLIVSIYFVLVLFMDNILDSISSDDLAIKPIVDENRVYYKLAAVLIFFFVNLTLFQAFYLSRTYEEQIINARNQLNQRNKELEELNSSKDKFHSIMAHDLRGPFKSILGLSDMLSKNVGSFEKKEIEEFSDHLNDTCQSTDRLLENLLEWSIMQTEGIKFNPEEIELCEVMKLPVQLLSKMAEEKNITLNLHYEKSLRITADQNMIKAILRNLISNAIKFTPRDGKIDISCKSEGSKVEISVKDSGIGMAEETVSKLFKIGEKVSHQGTENEKGTGLGLLLCKEFTNIHGGRISVKSELDKGSTFIVELPA